MDNNLNALNNYLFEQLERLNDDEELEKDGALEKELKRAKELLNENQADLITKYMFLEQQCKKQKEVINKLELENKVLKEQMVAMVKPNYTYGIR